MRKAWGMARDAREKTGSRHPMPQRTLLMETLVGLIQAAARQLDPLTLQETVRGVGAQLGRQAVSEYCYIRQAGGRTKGYTWAECLREIGEQFGWTLRVAVESDGVIRVDVLGCQVTGPDDPESHLSRSRLRTPGVSPGVKASPAEGWVS